MHLENPPERPLSRRINLPLLVLLAAALIVRLLFMSPGLLGGDSMGYAFGGLGTWIAHPPGFFGYCFIGWIVNQMVGNINHSFIYINITTCMIGIWCAYRLAKSIGLSEKLALLATASYAFSVNTLYFSDIAASYCPEGMFATSIALCAYQTTKTQSVKWALLTTFLWAIGGSVRQTSAAFLIPLWLFMLWRGRQFRALHWHALIAIPIIVGWMHANKHYSNALAGNPPQDTSGHNFWAIQVMMPSGYDPTKLGLDQDVKEATSQYHWPFMEVITWVDEKLGTHVLPPYKDFGAPPPDLNHAARLTGMQALKLGFYTLFSLPALLVVGVFLILPGKKRSLLATLPRGDWAFFAVWIVPPGMFFLVGHCGSFGYLQIYLSGLALLSVALLRICDPIADQPEIAGPNASRIFHATMTLVSAAFFVFARPFDTADPTEKTADILAFQYTGASIHRGLAVARSISGKEGRAERPEWGRYRSDAEIVALWERYPANAKAVYRPRAKP